MPFTASTMVGEKYIGVNVDCSFLKKLLEICKYGKILIRENVEEYYTYLAIVLNNLFKIYEHIICIKCCEYYLFIIDYINIAYTQNPTFEFILELFGNNLLLKSIKSGRLVLEQEVIEENNLPTIAMLNDLFASIRCVINYF